MTHDSQKLSVFEKIGYSFGDLAANLVFQTLLTFLAFFYTDIYGLTTEDSSLVMLVIGLIAAFVFNPLVAALADRTSTRWGKFRPWILWTALPLGIASILAFSTPDFTYQGKVIYAVITYVFLLLLYAGNNLPYAALSGVITGDMAERNSMSSYRFVAVMFAQFFVQVLLYPIVDAVGNGSRAVGIEKVMTWLAAIGTIMLLITFFTTKERIVSTEEQKASLKEDLQDLTKNRPWIIILGVTTLLFITLALKGGSYVYYFENYVDKNALTTFIQPILTSLNGIGLNFFGENPIAAGFGLFNGAGILFMIVGISISKSLADKYGKRNVFGLWLFISTLFILVFYVFEPTSVRAMFISQILHGFSYGVTIPLLWAMVADVADYSEWKNNRRATAIIFSAMLMGLKAGLTIGQSLIAWLLSIFHYDANITTQPAEAINGIKLSVSLFPSTFFIAAVALLFWYEIDKKMEVKIESDLKERRK